MHRLLMLRVLQSSSVRGVQAFDARVRRACSTRVFDARVRRACIIIKIEKTKAETQVLILVFPKKNVFF